MSWFRSKQPPATPNRTSFEDVIDAYAAVLSEIPKGMGGSAPESLLPFDKPLIKASMLEAAMQSEISKDYLTALEAAFCCLADFQPDGGGASVFAPPGIKLDQLTPEQITNLAQSISDGGDREVAMTKRISLEMLALRQEWRDALARRNSDA